ncbi:MAG: hypothetical protein HWN80_18030 [Candidatus Lokiarchaeota archaeon]|nr:hypothetical protein [Candidatus Lokiarchaeota archaeon]
MIEEKIPPTKKAYDEALKLSDEIVRNIELSEIPLANIALKTARLARLTNDFDMIKIMDLEISGYSNEVSGFVPKDQWEIGIAANREYETEDRKMQIYPESIEQLEGELSLNQTALEVAKDADISFSSASTSSSVRPYTGNWKERTEIRHRNAIASKRLASRRSLIYQYVLKKYLELRFSNIADDIFANIREKVDNNIGKLVPDSVTRFNAVYENLNSENTENWSNAVHSCRRILKDLANAVYPPNEDRKKVIDGQEVTIKLDEEHYINRILEFITQTSDSQSYQDVVGSQLKFIKDRLDSLLNASHKGTHTTIVSKEDANRIVVYTYLLIGDILSLVKFKN